jgi:hypothetical protein
VWWIKQLDAPRIFANVYRDTTAQTIASGGFTKVQHNGELSDPLSLYDNATNFRFTAPIAGKYSVLSSAEFIGGTSSDLFITVYVNGAEWKRGVRQTSGATIVSDVSAQNIPLSAGGYIEIYAFSSGASRNLGNTVFTSLTNYSFQSF